MWHTRGTDHSLTSVVITFLPPDTRPQRTGEHFVSFFLLRVHVLGHREPWGQGHFNP
jgi:hypothetical protein